MINENLIDKPSEVINPYLADSSPVIIYTLICILYTSIVSWTPLGTYGPLSQITPCIFILAIVFHWNHLKSTFPYQTAMVITGLTCCFYLSIKTPHILITLGLLGSILGLAGLIISNNEDHWFLRLLKLIPLYFVLPFHFVLFWIENIKTNSTFRDTILSGILYRQVIQPLLIIGFFITIYSVTNQHFWDTVNLLFTPLFILIKFIGDWSVQLGQYSLSHLLLLTIITLPFSSFVRKFKQGLFESLTPKSTSLETSYKDIGALTPTLIALNCLLLWFHSTELYSIIVMDWSSPSAWSRALHESMGGVILGTISGLCIYLYKRIDWDDQTTQFQAKIWAANNSIFVVLALIKCAFYWMYFGFTIKRVFLCAVLIGILLSFYNAYFMIQHKKGNDWFVNRSLESQYGCYIIAIVVCAGAGLFV